MLESLFIVLFLGLIVGLAALILFLVDKFTFRPGMSAEERKAVVDSRTGRWQRGYGFLFFIMAVIAMVVNAFNIGHETMGWRIAWFVSAAFVVLGYLSKSKNPED